MAVSQDGKHAYVTSADGVAIFGQNRTTGALTQPTGVNGCVSEYGLGSSCTDGTAVRGATSVAISRDGKHVYVVSEANAVAAFVRNRISGALTQLAGTTGCISQDGAGGEQPPVPGTCTDGRGLSAPFGVALSRDGRNVYVASQASSSSGAIAIFSRDPGTGAITQLAGSSGCVTGDGEDGCTLGLGVDNAFFVVVSRDGRNVYVSSASTNAGVAIFKRD